MYAALLGGVGGSFAYGDTPSRIAFALTKNRISQDFNTATTISELIDELLGVGQVPVR